MQIEFSSNDPSLFLASGESYVGPFRPSEVFEKLQKAEVSWVDHCYRETEGKWMRICDHPLFTMLQPEAPKPKPKLAAPPPPPRAAAPAVKWFLFQNETQTGPYLDSELKRLIQVGQVMAGAFVWQESFADWRPIREVPEFSTGAAAQAQVQAKATERRAAPRKPLVAQIYLTNQKEISSGVCRDISIGGMQVLTDSIPGSAGDIIRLNVMPPVSTGLKPFVAQGVIVRILEDKRGFSFRFTDIHQDARASIERYVS